MSLTKITNNCYLDCQNIDHVYINNTNNVFEVVAVNNQGLKITIDTLNLKWKAQELLDEVVKVVNENTYVTWHWPYTRNTYWTD